MRRFAPLLLAMLIASLLPSTPAASAPAHLTKTNTTSIHILGSFNGWNTALWTTDPGMTPDGTTWRDTVAIESWAVEQGYEQFKFVTDRAYDVPPDYCLCPDRVADYRALSGPVCAISGGLNVQMYADVPGQYAFTLDEAALTYSASLVQPFDATITGTVSIPGTSSPPVATVMLTKPGSPVASARALTDPATGRFSASRLDAGTYNLLVTAPGFPGGTANGVVVVPGGVTDAGTITLSGCTSQFTTIQVLGDFNNWDVTTPGMTYANCVWSATLHVVAGCYYMKFRTNNDWGNDYGTCTAQDPTCTTPLTGKICLVSDNLALGKINFASTDDYIFRIDEHAGTYQIVSMTTPVHRTSWGGLKSRYR